MGKAKTGKVRVRVVRHIYHVEVAWGGVYHSIIPGFSKEYALFQARRIRKAIKMIVEEVHVHGRG